MFEAGRKIMRVGLTLCLLLYFQLTTFVSVGQVVPGKVCRIDEGRLIFTLDSRWSSEERKKISRIFIRIFVPVKVEVVDDPV